MVKKEKINNNYDIRLTNDLIFYLVFGAETEESNKALTALLNVVLERKSDPIVDVSIVNTVHKGFQPGDKGTVMDIRAESDLGETYDVEMQRGSLAFFENRALVYGAIMVNSSLAKGDNYDKIKKNVVISFIDGLMFPGIPDLHTEFKMREQKWNISLTDRLSIHFLELGKVDDRMNLSDLSPLERFCAYLKYAGDDTKEDFVNELLETGEEAIVMSEHVFRKITEDESLQDLLRRQDLAEHDNATRMMLMEREATKRGLKRGLEQGLERGLEQGLERGLEQGLERGLEQGIAALILDNIEDGKTKAQILDKLQHRFNLDAQKAAYYYNKYNI